MGECWVIPVCEGCAKYSLCSSAGSLGKVGEVGREVERGWGLWWVMVPCCVQRREVVVL